MAEVTNHGTKYTINTMEYQIHPHYHLFWSDTQFNGKCLTFNIFRIKETSLFESNKKQKGNIFKVCILILPEDRT